MRNAILRAFAFCLIVSLPPLNIMAAPRPPKVSGYTQKLQPSRPKPTTHLSQAAKPTARPMVSYTRPQPTHTKPHVAPSQKPQRPRPHYASVAPKKDMGDEGDELTATRFNPCLNSISSKVTAIDSKLDILESLVDFCDDCASTPLFGPGPITIATPGNYCLAEDVNTITITASKVNLNLNGHTVSSTTTGITVAGVSPADIIIRNGIVQATNNATGTGIDLTSGGTEIIIANVTVKNWSAGITVEDVNKLLVQDSFICENVPVGLQLADSTNVEVRTCSFSSNSTGLLLLDNDSTSKGIKIEGCTFHQEQTALGNAVDITSGECIEIINCSATGEASQTAGFAISGNLVPATSGVLIKDCFACDFSDNGLASGNGFLVDAVNNICISNCVAKNNVTGFNLGNGTEGIVRQSVATNNETGFFWDATGHAEFYSNEACENTALNFDPAITSAPVTSPANARGVHNVDCDNTDPDQVEVIDSKVSAIASSDSRLDVIESKTDACCQSTTSKLMVIESKVDATAPCAAIPVTGGGLLSTYGAGATGVYCLTTDLTSTLTIDVSNVTVDLNGHMIAPPSPDSGIIIQATDVIIRNGTIISDGTGTAGVINNPVSLLQPDNIELHDLTITGWVSGISLGDTLINHNYHDLLVWGNTTGIVIGSGSEYVLRNNQITFNDTGITATGNQIVIDACTIDQNTTTGISSSGNQITINNCTIDDNTTSGILLISGSLDVDITDSTLNENGIGIDINLGAGSTRIVNSTINTNTTGMVVNGQRTTATQCTMSVNTTGMLLSNTDHVTVEQTVFDDNTTSALIVNGSTNINFNECTFHLGTPVITSGAKQVTFTNCTSSTQAENGYQISSSSKVVLQDCSVQKDSTTGAGYSMADVIDLYILRSIAQGGDTGFALMGTVDGSIVNECTAIGASICGFDAVSTTSASFVGNVGKRNGATPAGSPDTNYCLDGAGTTFTPPDGPGPAPYYQTSPLVATSAWRNITLPL